MNRDAAAPASAPGITHRLAFLAAAGAVFAGVWLSAPLLAGDVDVLDFTDRQVHTAGHIVVYGGLALALLRAFGGRIAWAWLAAAALGAAEEWHQAFVPGRSAQWSDVLLNAAAITAALAAVWVGRRVAR